MNLFHRIRRENESVLKIVYRNIVPTRGGPATPWPDYSAVRTRSKRYPQSSLGDSQPPRSSPALQTGAMCPFFPNLMFDFSKYPDNFHLY
jgi:hypothetical protein